MSVATRETMEDVHESTLRKVFLEQFKVYIPADLSHDQKSDIKGQMFMRNLKAVTAKLPNINGVSTMIFENPMNDKKFVYGFLLIKQEDGTFSREFFTAEEGDKLAERIGEEVFASARKFKS